MNCYSKYQLNGESMLNAEFVILSLIPNQKLEEIKH